VYNTQNCWVLDFDHRREFYKEKSTEAIFFYASEVTDLKYSYVKLRAYVHVPSQILIVEVGNKSFDNAANISKTVPYKNYVLEGSENVC
jgi:hypothetical protein